MTLTFQPSSKLKMMSMAALAVGAVLAGLSFFVNDPTRVWSSFLINNFYFFGLGIFGAVVIAISYVAHAGWYVVLKRVAEAMSSYIVVGLLGMIVLGLFGKEYVYEWAIDDIVKHDTILQGKESFLNDTFYFGLIAFALVVWFGGAMVLRKYSLKEDQEKEGSVKYFWKSYKFSAAFMWLWAFSFCFAIFNWVMSIEPHWYSTIYAVYVFASILVMGFVFLNVAGIYLKGINVLPWFNANHQHDTSKFTFGFSIFWAYIFVSQLLLIWYANVPEETPYYLLRWGRLEGEASYKWLWYINLIINFAAPFLIFMTREAKRKNSIILTLAGIIFVAKWIDFYLLIAPGAFKLSNHVSHLHIEGMPDHAASPGFGLPEIGFFLFFLGLFLMVVTRSYSKAPVVPKNHPYLEESLTHHT
ncbi:MAG: quinol:cytochrome C oxidoreductase [Bacteroidetes bacterium]|nr:quinol:cytochrome C oxidoreductase [Bacteroidota bacterium]